MDEVGRKDKADAGNRSRPTTAGSRLELANSTGIVTIGLTRTNGDHMPKLRDYYLRIPLDLAMTIQEAHPALEHIFLNC